MQHLNAEQLRAVTHTKGALLIVAGAGTGKTSVITEKIRYVVEQHIALPEEILALSFNDKAAREIQDRVDGLLDIGYVDFSIATFHSFCRSILEEYGLHIGLQHQFRVLTETDAWLLLREEIERLPLQYYRPLGNPTKHISALIRHFSDCRDELISPAAYAAYAEDGVLDLDLDPKEERTRLRELASLYAAYDQLLHTKGVLDFSSLIYYAVQLLRERSGVRLALQKKYRCILVDEFQDVNHAQYELIKLLAGEQTMLTVVGDDDQSIYAFRGASVGNILRFADDFPHAEKIVLTKNYRSGQEILDLAYRVVTHNNPDRLEIKLGIDKRLVATGDIRQGVVSVGQHARGEDEVKAVVEEICELVKSGVAERFDQIAILVRAHSHATPFVEALARSGVPYTFFTEAGLYRQPIILDILSYLTVLFRPSDDAAIFRLLRLPCLALSAPDAERLFAYEERKKISLFAALSDGAAWGISPEGEVVVSRLTKAIRSGADMALTRKPTEIIYHGLFETGYLQYLTKEEQSGNDDVIRAIDHVKTFFDEVEAFQAGNDDATVHKLLERYRVILEAGDEGSTRKTDDDTDAVQILTVHASKGLEFPFVFLVNLVEERFPTRRRADPMPVPTALIHEQLPQGDEHIEEERRLFYVAVTRAKRKVHLSFASDYGGVRAKKVSRFLVEAGLSDEPKPKKNMSKKTLEETAAPLPTPRVSGARTVNLPSAWSFSQIESYLTCPYRYKLQHVLRIPTKGKGAMSFGSTMHHTLQRFYEEVQQLNGETQTSLFSSVATETVDPVSKKGVRVPSQERLLTLYDEAWISDWYENKKDRETYYEKGKDILRAFYTANEGQWTVPLLLESSFTVIVGGYKLRGRIDRVDQLPDGTLEIIDYKTGNAKETVTADEKHQLLIYQIAAQALPQYRHHGPVSNLTFYFLKDGVKTSFVGNDKELEKLQQKIVSTIEHIAEGDFSPSPSPIVCRHCDFKSICEYRVV